MSDTFGTSQMNEALEESSKGAFTLPMDKEAAAARAREHNWAPKVAYDYSVYAGTGPHEESGNVEGVSTEPAWASNAAKYEWTDEYGDVGPRIPQLEDQLFNDEFLMRSGAAIEAYKFEVVVEGPVPIRPVREFDDAGLHPVMRENVKLCRYDYPTPIQAYTIPAILSGFDVVASAQTGSGKTASYLIPILSRLMGKAKKLAAPRPNSATYNPATDRVRAEPLVLIIVPTRELATQIFDEARRLCYRSMLRPCVAYGGGPKRLQEEELQKGCDVLIGTTGRLIDFMNKPTLLSFNRLKFTVIDEADEMLQSDWEDEMKMIMTAGDANHDEDHTYMMFSATFPKEARAIARQYMNEDYVRIRVGRIGSTHKNVNQNIVWVEDSQKRQALYDLLFAMPPARTLIFVNSKRQADLIDDYLFNLDLPSTSIHSERTQREREDALRAFRTGTCPIMVATGVSARGLDIRNVMHVINYDLPSGTHGGIDEYIHRIGRTARIGNNGLATSFYNDRNEDIADDLVKILVESEQQVPDFLQDRIPEGKITWDDESEADDAEGDAAKEAGGAAGGETWGADSGAATAGGDDSWGNGGDAAAADDTAGNDDAAW